MKKNKQPLKDIRIHTRFRLSALWTATLFCYVYGDFFTLFIPGRIENLVQGQSGAGNTTPLKLLLFAVLMCIPALMLCLSLVLKPAITRWLNIATGIFFTLVMVLVIASTVGRWMLFYTFLGIIETLLTLLVVRCAWKWERENIPEAAPVPQK